MPPLRLSSMATFSGSHDELSRRMRSPLHGRRPMAQPTLLM
jgi:hypothetical protein